MMKDGELLLFQLSFSHIGANVNERNGHKMDYAKISDSDLEKISFELMFFADLPHNFFRNADEKTARKYKKKLLKNGSVIISGLGDVTRPFFAPDTDPMLLMEFLCGCDDEHDRRKKQYEKDFFDEFSDLPLLTVKALWQIKESCNVSFEDRGTYSEIPSCYETVFGSDFCQISLTADDLESTPMQYDPDSPVIYDKASLTRDGDRFYLRCKYTDLETDSEGDACFSFSSPKATAKVYSGCEFSFDPWRTLTGAAEGILRKHEILPELLCPTETELLPLAKELSLLDLTFEEKRGFSLLKERAARYGFDELVSLLSSAEQKPDKSYVNVTERLNELNKSKYEPLWRELFELITDSQKDYPKTSDLCKDKERLTALRREIEVRLMCEGYEGEYPDFYKCENMRGLHLAYSYGLTYFVGMQKNVRYFIHCEESFHDDELYIEFISGTDLTRKGECRDIYSCMFNDKGRRLYETTLYSHGTDELMRSVQTAVKRAECKPLGKYEKAQEYGPASYAIGGFFLWLIIGGAMFSIAFHLLFFPLMWGLEFLFGIRESFWEFMSSIPWLHSVLFAWIGFGGACGIIDVLAKRK